MKVRCDREKLRSALDIVSGMLPANAQRPILLNVLIQPVGEALELIATDLEVGVRQRFVPESRSEDRSVALHGRTLVGIAREVVDPEISIRVNDSAATLKCGRSFFELLLADSDDYPEVPRFPEEKGANVLRIHAADLVKMIDRTIFAAAKEESRYAINGVSIRIGDGKVEMAATDGRRLSRVRGKLSAESKVDETIIVPPKMLKELRKRAQAAGDNAVVEIAVKDRQMLARLGDTTLISRLIEGNFPKYEDVIPKGDAALTVTANRAGLISLLRQARLMVSDEAMGVTLLMGVGKLHLETRASERGEAKLDMEVRTEGEGPEMRFDVRYILEALEIFEGDEVEILIYDQVRPALLREDDAFVHILMPMSVHD